MADVFSILATELVIYACSVMKYLEKITEMIICLFVRMLSILSQIFIMQIHLKSPSHACQIKNCKIIFVTDLSSLGFAVFCAGKFFSDQSRILFRRFQT